MVALGSNWEDVVRDKLEIVLGVLLWFLALYGVLYFIIWGLLLHGP